MKFKPACLRFNLLDFEKVEFLESDDSDSDSSDSEEDEDLCVFKSNEQVDCNGMPWRLFYECRVVDNNRAVIYVLPQITTERQRHSNAVAKCTFAIKNSKGSTLNEIDAEFNTNLLRWRFYGWFNGMEHTKIMIADRRTLKSGYIDMTIQIKDKGDFLCRPKKEHSDKMLSLLKSGEKSDASLTVGGKVFRIHSQILHAHTPILASYCDDTIIDMSAETFQILLEYIYVGRIPTEENILKHGNELISASNKYELVELKMIVENTLVKERIMTKQNVSDYILFADAQSCALLKEYAIAYFLLHHREILQSENSIELRKSAELLSEILMLTGRENEDIVLNVDGLRKELKKRGLDVDGSKDALISRLDEAKRQRLFDK